MSALAASMAAGAAGAAAWCAAGTNALVSRRLIELGLSTRAPSRAQPARPGAAMTLAGALGLVGGLGVAVTLVAGPVAGLLVAAAAFALLRQRRRAAARRDRDGQHRASVALCSALAAELRAGAAPVDALSAAADVVEGRCADLARSAAAGARLGAGVGLRPGAVGGGNAPARADDGRGDSGTDPAARVMRQLAACWAVSARTGTGLAAAVDRLAEGLRVAEEQRAELAAQLAGPRATARLLAVLPVAGVAMAAALGASPANVLLHTRWGASCLLAGLALDIVGVAWTDRLTTAALES